MVALVDLLGKTLLKGDDEEVETSHLEREGQVVGLYFSAQWCPPCVGFTPKLIEFYNIMLTKTPEKELQIVFISSDKEQNGFKDHFLHMPWLALPFQDRDRKARLSKRFKVHQIPVLVFLDGKTGKVITTDGRNNVLDDPQGISFPWYPQPLESILRGTVSCVTGDLDAEENLRGKVVGYFFSAHWCPPCRVFTPVLNNAYQKLRAKGLNFEVLFVTSDRTEESYDDYFSTMPWLALPYGDNRIKDVTKYFGIQGIPSLILVNEDNEIISSYGRAVISKDPDGEDFPWPAKPVDELNQITMPTLNQSTCVVFFTDGEDDLIAQARAALNGVASTYVQQQKASLTTDNEKPELFFLYESNDKESGEMADTLRNLIERDDDDTPLLVLFDILDTKFHVHQAEIITPDSIQQLINDFVQGKLEYDMFNKAPS